MASNMTNTDYVSYQKQREQQRGLKKVTFLIKEDLIKQFDTKYLSLQLDRGKNRIAPKEVMIEEAIAIALEELNLNPDEWLSRCTQRHRLR